MGLLVLALSACGVKGEPLPPDKPTPVGRGRPTYRRATEGIQLQKHQSVDEDDEKLKDQKDEETEY